MCLWLVVMQVCNAKSRVVMLFEVNVEGVWLIVT